MFHETLLLASILSQDPTSSKESVPGYLISLLTHQSCRLKWQSWSGRAGRRTLMSAAQREKGGTANGQSTKKNQIRASLVKKVLKAPEIIITLYAH